MIRPGLFRLVGCLLAAAAFLCPGPAGAQAVTDTAAPGLRVKVTAVRHTILSSQMPGRVARIAVRDGESFVADQILADMDCSIPKAQLKQAEAAAHKQDAVYATTRKLESLNSRSRLEVAVARAEAEQAAAAVTAARAAVDRCTVRAPFSGRVAERLVQENQYVNEGQPLLEVLDPGELELEFISPSRWLPWFTPGYAFTVHVDETGRDYAAELTRLSGKVDAVSQSIKSYGRFVEPDAALLPGMSGEARILPPQFSLRTE